MTRTRLGSVTRNGISFVVIMWWWSVNDQRAYTVPDTVEYIRLHCHDRMVSGLAVQVINSLNSPDIYWSQESGLCGVVLNSPLHERFQELLKGKAQSQCCASISKLWNVNRVCVWLAASHHGRVFCIKLPHGWSIRVWYVNLQSRSINVRIWLIY